MNRIECQFKNGLIVYPMKENEKMNEQLLNDHSFNDQYFFPNLNIEFYNVEIYLGYGKGYTHILENDESVYWSNLKNDNLGEWFIFPVASFADYSNTSFVEVSNYEIIQDEWLKHPLVFDVYGDYGSKGLLFHRTMLEIEEIQELINSLENYILLDEENYYEKCHESYCKSWDDFGNDDFIRGLIKKFSLEYNISEFLYDCKNDSMMTFFESLMPSGEFYIDESSQGVSILTSNAVKNCTSENLINFIISERANRNAKPKLDKYKTSLLYEWQKHQIGMFLPSIEKEKNLKKFEKNM